VVRAEKKLPATGIYGFFVAEKRTGCVIMRSLREEKGREGKRPPSPAVVAPSGGARKLGGRERLAPE
jgi:hypothetical protein